MKAFLKTGNGEAVQPKAATAPKDASNSIEQPLPWVEKYRPKTVDELSSQEEVVAVLKKCASGIDLPNFLFYGPPGTGKTSAILALARQLFGPEIYRERVLELNASDERGIQVVREKIKGFAQFTASSTTASGAACIPLKIVILDEADCMTSSAQAALRRTMEKESKTTRFCLICNYVTRIIEPLTSRCAKFRFKPLDASTQMERMKYIAEQENVFISDEALKRLIEISDGDMRRAVTSLQSAARFSTSGAEVSAEDVAEMCGVIPDGIVDELISACRRGRYEQLEKTMNKIMSQGYAAYDVLLQVHDRVVMEDEDTNDIAKSKVCEKLAICEKRLLDGADEYLQLLDLGCTMISAFQK